MWLNNSLPIEVREGGEEHSSILWGDIELNYDEELKLQYLEFNERHTKTRIDEHYENTPMQYTAIFHGCKNNNFQSILFLLFSYFWSKHILLVHVRTASLRRF